MTWCAEVVSMTTITIVQEPTTSASELPSWPARTVIASLLAGAAVIHLAMVPAHAQEWVPLGVAFAASGWTQLVLAGLIVARSSRRLLHVGLVANVAFLAGWAISRTAGLPFGPMAGEAEAVSVIDGLCVGLEVAAMAATLVVLARPTIGSRITRPRFLVGAALPAFAVVALTTAALASPAGTHDHGAAGHGDDHAVVDDGHGDHAAMDHADDDHAAMDHAADDHATMDHAADDHATDHEHDAATDQAADEHEHGDHASGDVAEPDVAEPGIVQPGVAGHETDHEAHDDHAHDADCSAPVTVDQLGAADDLIRETLAASAKYEQFDAAIADGYVPITPANAPLVHYGNIAYMVDGQLLDPNRIESLMYAYDKNRTPYFVGTMYLNDDASIAPPSPAGCLLQWHDHTNLCIAPGQGMTAVVQPDGSCPAGSSNEVTTQMVHLWTIPLPSGPLTHDATPEQIKAGVLAMKAGS